MKFTALITATALSLLLASNANALLIDLTGQLVDGAGANVITASNGSGAVTDVEFEFNYEAGNTGNLSWGSELLVEILHVNSGTAAQIGTAGADGDSCDDFNVACEFDLNWAQTSGVFSASGSVGGAFAGVADGSGNWQITLSDSFDDDGTDGQFLADSNIDITKGDSIPEPGTLLLVGLGLAGLARWRRRI